MDRPLNARPGFLAGVRDGLPIGLGYFAVSFSIGIAAHNADLNALQGFIMSVLNHASAGEYAGISAIRTNATYWELMALILIANARYLLMSTALSQKISPDTPLRHRFLIGFCITDEIFGISIAYPGFLRPVYTYGAFLLSCLMWAGGTASGILVGNILPAVAVQALSAAIYGMFLAIIIPPSRKNPRVLAVVLISFAASYLFSVLPGTSALSESIRVILLTVLISVGAALVMPVKEEDKA